MAKRVPEDRRKKQTAASIISQRKRLARRARKQNPERPVGWRGGRLYFLDDKTKVKGFPDLPKPGAKVLIKKEAFPEPKAKQTTLPESAYRTHYGSSPGRSW